VGRCGACAVRVDVGHVEVGVRKTVSSRPTGEIQANLAGMSFDCDA
jgi:hypothetical protein